MKYILGILQRRKEESLLLKNHLVLIQRLKKLKIITIIVAVQYINYYKEQNDSEGVKFGNKVEYQTRFNKDGLFLCQKVFQKINLYGKIQMTKIIEWKGKQ